MDIFSSWKNTEGWKVILCPHPATNISDIKRYQEKLNPNLDIYYEASLRTYEVITASKLVISGYSASAIESCFFGVKAVRFVKIGTFPLFEYEKIIPVFHNGEMFIKWFNDYDWSFKRDVNQKKELDKLIENYYHKIDGKTSSRMWDYLMSQSILPHNARK